MELYALHVSGVKAASVLWREITKSLALAAYVLLTLGFGALFIMHRWMYESVRLSRQTHALRAIRCREEVAVRMYGRNK